MELTQTLHRLVQQDPDRPLTGYAGRIQTARECADRVARLAGGLRALGGGEGGGQLGEHRGHGPVRPAAASSVGERRWRTNDVTNTNRIPSRNGRSGAPSAGPLRRGRPARRAPRFDPRPKPLDRRVVGMGFPTAAPGSRMIRAAVSSVVDVFCVSLPGG